MASDSYGSQELDGIEALLEMHRPDQPMLKGAAGEVAFIVRDALKLVRQLKRQCGPKTPQESVAMKCLHGIDEMCANCDPDEPLKPQPTRKATSGTPRTDALRALMAEMYEPDIAAVDHMLEKYAELEREHEGLEDELVAILETVAPRGKVDDPMDYAIMVSCVRRMFEVNEEKYFEMISRVRARRTHATGIPQEKS